MARVVQPTAVDVAVMQVLALLLPAALASCSLLSPVAYVKRVMHIVHVGSVTTQPFLSYRITRRMFVKLH
jgi:hypothetical protein